MNHPGTLRHTLTDKLVARKDNGIGWIVFNNPARHNAVSANNAPLTIGSVKRALLEIAKDTDERDLAGCQKMVDDCYASGDYKEGQSAFMEKRKPVFQGR